MLYMNIYRSNDAELDHNENLLTRIKSVKITEEINGIFNLDTEILITDPNVSMLVRGNIIKCKVPKGRDPQLFRITRVVKNLKSVTANCIHIGIADLSANFIRDVNVVGKNRTQAIRQLLGGTLQDHRFTVEGDELDSYVENLRVVRKNPIDAVFGSDSNTIVSRFGGEYQFDNFKIKTFDQLGSDNGVIIAHRKNITGVEETIDDDGLITRIIPQGANELLLPEYHIDSPKVNDYEKIYHSHVTFSDIGVSEEDGITQEMAYQQLRDAVNSMFKDKQVDQIFFNYKINFIELSKTEEYKNYKVLESVNLGDNVLVKVGRLNIELLGRVFKYIYDPIKDQFDEIEIGFKKPAITDAVNSSTTSGSVSQVVSAEVESLDKKLTERITGVDRNIRLDFTSADEDLQNQIDEISKNVGGSVTTDDVKKVIEENPMSIRTGFNKISTKVQLTADGSFKVTNSKGEITIDGSLNTFKILKSEVVDISAGTTKKYTKIVYHGLNYIPTFDSYLVKVDQAVKIPSYEIGDTLEILSAVNVRSDNKNIYIDYIRSETTKDPSIKVVLFIYKESLM